MNFVKYDLGQLNGGELATVEVRERANVLLMDQNNFMRLSGPRSWVHLL